VSAGNRIARNVAALAGGQLITWTMTLAWTLVVPRVLGPAGMGLIVTALSVSSIFAILLGFGTKNYVVREIVVRRDQASSLVATATVFRMLLVPLFLAVLLAYAHFARYGHEGTLVLYLAGGATLLVLLAEPMQAAFQAIERMHYLAISDVINKSVQSLVGIALVVLGFGAVGFAACWMAMSGVVLVLDAIWLSRYVQIDLRTSTRAVRRMAKGSISYWAFGVFFMVYLWIDSAMLSLMTNSTVVGWYGVPTRLFQSAMVVPVLLSTAWLPRLVETFERAPDQLRRAARTPIELVLVLGVPIAAGIAVAAGPLIRVLYGQAYARSVPVMIILGLCIVPMYLNIMLSQVLIAAKRQVVWTWVMAGAMLFNPAVNALLISWTQARWGNGAIGAAVSLAITEVAIAGVGVMLVGAEVLRGGALERLGRTGIASAAMCAIAFGLHGAGTALSLAGAALAFTALAIALRLVNPTEAAFARAQLQRVWGQRPGLLGRRPAPAPSVSRSAAS
jgi:O-antigen/teichoic acid export membrane protein